MVVIGLRIAVTRYIVGSSKGPGFISYKFVIVPLHVLAW
jgi:hypothetical protein